MSARGCAVRCIQSDRGTEYFAQEHATIVDRERALHDFSKVCEDANIRHVLRPIEFKEKLAEACFKEHFSACRTVLWAERLSPCFWAGCVAYSLAGAVQGTA